MRPHTSRSLGVIALSCAVVFATAGSTMAAPDLPGRNELLAQVDELGQVGRVLEPTTQLIENVLKQENGQITPAEAQKFLKAVTAAVNKVEKELTAAKQACDAVKATASKLVKDATSGHSDGEVADARKLLRATDTCAEKAEEAISAQGPSD